MVSKNLLFFGYKPRYCDNMIVTIMACRAEYDPTTCILLLNVILFCLVLLRGWGLIMSWIVKHKYIMLNYVAAWRNKCHIGCVLLEECSLYFRLLQNCIEPSSFSEKWKNEGGLVLAWNRDESQGHRVKVGATRKWWAGDTCK